ncbi:MAG: hypothetical protein ACRBK7_16780 [Acidimicrobiales bacterium]
MTSRSHPRAAPGSSGALLRAESPEAVRELRSGSMASIGRAGSIPVGSANDRVPAIAAVLECADTNWTVRVPIETKLWIDVMVDGVRLWAGTGGQMCARSEPNAELRVRTTTDHHRVGITFATDQRFSIPASGQTVAADLILTPENPNHRAWIVACGERLRYWNAPSLKSAEIARLLGCSQTNATTKMNRARDEIQVWAEASQVDLENRDEAVDWLVSTGAVTVEIYRRALEFESEQLRSRT